VVSNEIGDEIDSGDFRLDGDDEIPYGIEQRLTQRLVVQGRDFTLLEAK